MKILTKPTLLESDIKAKIVNIEKSYIKGQRFKHFETTLYGKGSELDQAVIHKTLSRRISISMAILALVASVAFLLSSGSQAVTGLSVTKVMQDAISSTSGFSALLIAAVALGILIIELTTSASVENAAHGPVDYTSSYNKRIEGIMSRAESMIDEGNHKAAIRMYNDVLAVHPGNNRALLNKGFVYDEMGRYQSAIDMYNKLLDADPWNPKALYNKGMALLEMNRRSEAYDHFSKALKINKNDIPTLRKICFILFSRKQYLSVVTFCNRALEFDRKNIDMLIIKGLALERSGNKKKALEAYNSALKIDPTDAWAFKCKHLLLEKNT